jgi:hypothetical protein
MPEPPFRSAARLIGAAEGAAGLAGGALVGPVPPGPRFGGSQGSML